MADWVRVGRADEVLPGRMIGVRVDGEDVAVYNVNGEIFATRDSCTHQNYPLSKGALRGKYVRCGLHGWEFDVKTGEYQGNPDVRVRRFPVKVENGEIFVKLEPLPPPPPRFVSRDDA